MAQPPPGFVLDAAPGPQPVPRVIEGPPREPAPRYPDEAQAIALRNARSEQEIAMGPAQARRAEADARRAELATAAAERTSGAYPQSALDAFDRAISSIDRLGNHPGFRGAVGSLSFNPSDIAAGQIPFGTVVSETGAAPGSPARDFAEQLEALKAQVFLPMVQSMRGMGALSNMEGQRLTDAIGAMNPNMSEQGFRESLARIREDLLRYRARGAPAVSPEQTQVARDATAPVQAGVAAARDSMDGRPPAPRQPPGTTLEFGRSPDTAPPGASDFQRDLQAAINSGAFRTPEDIINFGQGRGFNIDRAQAERAIQARGRGVDVGVQEPEYQAPDISDARGGGSTRFSLGMFDQPLISVDTGQIDAAARGAADTVSVGLSDRMSAAGNTLFNGGTYDDNLRREFAITDYDSENNFGSRTAGQLAGALALPGGAVSGLGRQAAVGGGYGALYGFNAGRGSIGDRAENALLGGAIGALVPPAFEGARRGTSALFGRSGGSAETMAAATRQGIDLLPADVGGPMTRRLTAGGAQLPFAAGPIVRGAQRTNAQAGAARDRVAAGALEPEGAGEAAIQGSRDFIRRTSGRGSQLYTRAEEAAGDARITPVRAWDVLDRNIAELADTPGGAEGLSTLQTLRQELTGEFSVSGMRRMRSTLRDHFIKGGLRGSDLERRVGQVIDAASEDVVNGLRAQGRGQAARAYGEADRYWRNRLRTIDNVLEPIIGAQAGRSGEEVVQAIQRVARGNAQRLSQFIRALPEDEAETVRATLISQLGRPSAGTDTGQTFSLNQFLTSWNQMTPRARQVLFNGPSRSALEDLATVARGARQSAAYANRSNTGGAGNVASMLTGFGTSGISIPLEMISGRLLASPRFARWLAGVPRGDNPQLHISRLSAVATRSPAIAQEVLGLQRALLSAVNDNASVISRSAASGGGADANRDQ